MMLSEIIKQKRTAIEEGDFAGLLVRRREGFLEAGIPFPELVASSLLGLDALLADCFAARVTRRVVVGINWASGLEFLIIFVIGLVVGPRRLTLVRRARSGPVGRHRNGVEALRAGNRGVAGGRTGSTAAADPARGEAVRKLATAQVVRQHRGRDVGEI